MVTPDRPTGPDTPGNSMLWNYHRDYCPKQPCRCGLIEAAAAERARIIAALPEALLECGILTDGFHTSLPAASPIVQGMARDWATALAAAIERVLDG